MIFPYQTPGHKIQLQNTIFIQYDTKTQTFTLTMFIIYIIIKQIKTIDSIWAIFIQTECGKF